MFFSGSRIFCTPRHAIEARGLAYERRRPNPSLKTIYETLAEAFVGRLAKWEPLEVSAADRIEAMKTSLSQEDYRALLGLFSRHGLFMEDADAERLRAAMEALLEQFTLANRHASLEGPLSAEQRTKYASTGSLPLVRGPAEYFLLSIAPRGAAYVVTVALDQANPVALVKL